MAIRNKKLRIIRKLVHRQIIPSLQSLLDTVEPADLSDILDKFTPNEQRIMLTALHLSGKAGAILTEMSKPALENTLEGLSPDMLIKIISQLQANDGVFILQHLPQDRAFEILEKLPEQQSERIEEIMKYPPETAGSLMNTTFQHFNENLSTSEALERVREWTRNNDDPIYTIYITDETQHLSGTVSFRELALATPEKKIFEIMDVDPLNIKGWENKEKAANLIVKYDLVSLPVIDDNFRLIGIIMIDDMIDTIMSSSEEAYHIQGITQEDTLDTPVGKAIKSRIPWVFINLCTAFMASSVVGLFESSIQKYVALATFMPMVAGLGGNSGNQALGVTIRALALKQIDRAKAIQNIFRQITVSFSMGLLTGTITGIIAYLLKGNFTLGIVVLLAMVINLTIAGLIGSGIPLVLKKIGQDPALGGGILITAATDSLGFLAFLGIATLMLA
ncbi:MAG: magnesium transporter [Deltaproteobacteria bacterium]|jgi:magnesium transporter|nr:magnesium transporter [Deltaproteobacteria bacterium]